MSPILETAFSLIFVYLIFSLITSWIVEYISMRLQRRSKMLRQYVIDALSDKFNKNWGLLIYSHPLIEVLHREIQLPKGFSSLFYSSKISRKRRLPAYIPSDQFASALIDLIIHHDRPTKFMRDDTGKQVLVKDTVTDKTFIHFLEGLERLDESETKITLAALSRKVNINDTSNDGLNQLSQQIAEWYDNGMDRLNGWYKRATRQWLFFTGLAVAIVFNVNTIVIVNRLYADPQLRSAISQAAENYLSKNPELKEPYGFENLDSLKTKVNELRSELQPLQLPIGWKSNQVDESSLYRLATWKNWVYTFTKVAPDSLLGWLLTAFALSFGAPFWFDALKKITNVRSAGLRPSSKAQ